MPDLCDDDDVTHGLRDDEDEDEHDAGDVRNDDARDAEANDDRSDASVDDRRPCPAGGGMSVVVLEADRSLLDAFRRGERAALAQVFVAYSDDVARQVRAARVAVHDVESIVQDVFIKAFAEPARLSYDGLRPYGAWLNTITKHVLIDEIRKRRRVDLRAPEQMPTLTADEDQALVQEDAELAAVVQAWRRSLSAEEQALFAARFEEAKSFPQAAKSLGWSEIRVRKQDTALRSRLLSTLRQHGFLQKAKVSIGQSLLARRDKQKP